MLIDSYLVKRKHDGVSYDAYEKEKIDQLLSIIINQTEGSKPPSTIRNDIKFIIETAIGEV